MSSRTRGAPALRLVEPNTYEPEAEHPIARSDKSRRLTFKQERFAQLVASGLTYSEAYRQAYDVSPTASQAIAHRESCLLMDNPKIAERVSALAKEREKEKPLDPVQTRELIKRKLFDIASDSKTPAMAKLKALELLGKVRGVGMFAEISEVEVSKGDSKERAEKLKAMLNDLMPKDTQKSQELRPNADTEGEPGEGEGEA